MKQKISPAQKALNLWAIILIIWSIYRANVKMPEWFDEFIAKPLVFILPVFYYIKNVDKKGFFSSLWIKPKQLINDLALGLGIGAIFFVTALFANYIKFHRIISLGTTFTIKNIFLVVIIALATGISEEILSRGFVLKKLYEESKNIYTSSFFASILFFFLHVPILFTNAKIVGNMLILFMATDLILSLVNSFIYLDRKSLVLPILIHAMYNIALTFFI